MKDALYQAWESRANFFKDNKEAVMQQSFPDLVNSYIHALHIKEISRYINSSDTYKCLDLGCGYGRVASTLTEKYSNIYIYGMDISDTFVSLFNKKLKKRGRAQVGDLRKLPFKKNTFDIVYCIVSLMYINDIKDQQKAVDEIVRVLKPTGTAILIEPNYIGDNLIKLFGFLPFILRIVLKRKKVETFGRSFHWNAIDRLVYRSGAKLVRKSGYTFFTLFLLPTLLLAKVSTNLAEWTLRLVDLLDTHFRYARISHVITYIIKK